MGKDIIELSGIHTVYDSLRLVLSILKKKCGFDSLKSISPDYSNSKFLVMGKTSYFQYTPIKFEKRNLYVVRSPLIALGAWEAALRRIPFLLVEEYSERSSRKNDIVKALLLPFRNIPFIAQTRRTEQFMKKSGARVFLVPPAEKKRKGAGQRDRILFVGRLVDSKNPLLMLKLAEKFPDEKFVAIGKGPLLETLAEKVKSVKNLEIIPHVESRGKLFEHYANAKLLIHPAFKDPIGHVIIEALSAQTPVLASSGAGASDFLPKEWVLDPKDEDAWVEKVRHILSHQKESIKKAEKIFEKEHLDIDDPYFEKIAEELAVYIRKRWPKLFKNP